MVVLYISVSLWWGQPPETFDVRKKAIKYAEQTDSQKIPYGFVYAHTLASMFDLLKEKPGGYILDDNWPPGIFLDNIRSWELGAMFAFDDGYIGLYKNFAKDQLQAFKKAGIGNTRQCFFCAGQNGISLSEEQLEQRILVLHDYMNKLQNSGKGGGTMFYLRADYLVSYLTTVRNLLNPLMERLMASSDRFLSEPERPPGGRSMPDIMWQQKTPWYLIDNTFYLVQGYSWGVLHVLKAIEIDFKEVLDRRDIYLLNRVTHALESVVLMSSDVWVSSKDSMAMASYLYIATKAVVDLRKAMELKAKYQAKLRREKKIHK